MLPGSHHRQYALSSLLKLITKLGEKASINYNSTIYLNYDDRLMHALPKLLNLSELRDDTSFKNIIELQSELVENSDQILSIAASLPNEPIGSLSQTDHKHFKEIKEFRRGGVSSQILFLGDDLGWMYSFGLVRHEFLNIQDHWAMELPGYDEQLTRLTQFIKPRIHHLDPEEEEEEEEEEYDDDDDDDEEKLASIDKSAIPLAELLIPIIKLSRLFFKKLAKDGLNKTPLKPFTDMNSYQLTRLGDSAGRMSCDLDAIVRCIKESDDYDEADTTLEVMQTINRIRYAFDSHLLLVILYIVPLLPRFTLLAQSLAKLSHYLE
ncbi:hypothetical protein PCASD_20373 [Puccinia coronata f. sp. avenae]|uniref:Uncharacterized protein n=1 Tax=Puccinia coronata f. sp. avenae TaxID=200324 RepID=A0A2N5SQB7_9BASI|nr:hypothetical protein PCASD_20373 [Puccinia coronata f. sp. avenae]